MLHMFYRTLLSVALVALPANVASAASFLLPSDAAITVEKFTFPESSGHAAEQNLSAMLHGRLAETLQQAGFTVDFSPPASRTEEGAGGNDGTSMTVTPITENDEGKTPEAPPPGNAAAESSEPGKTETAERENPQPATEEPGENGAQGVIRGVFASQALPVPPVYTVAGRVTLLRENIGAPTRIGGGIGIRAESVLHCTYRVEDAAGNVLISATASGSAARLVSNAQNVDAVIANLNEKVVLSVAEKIASGLSGMDAGPSARPVSPDRSYYEDSPGKRLKQN